VTEPEFFKALDQQLAESSLDDVKAYLRWHVARASSPMLSKDFVNENFAFSARRCAAWKCCVRAGSAA